MRNFITTLTLFFVLQGAVHATEAKSINGAFCALIEGGEVYSEEAFPEFLSVETKLVKPSYILKKLPAFFGIDRGDEEVASGENLTRTLRELLAEAAAGT